MSSSTERAVLAGGCFWGMQDLIRKYPGVISTRVGYTGGDVPNATYRKHGTSDSSRLTSRSTEQISRLP
jgi:peptide-methionine (S)-S-oxide reductase